MFLIATLLDEASKVALPEVSDVPNDIVVVKYVFVWVKETGAAAQAAAEFLKEMAMDVD